MQDSVQIPKDSLQKTHPVQVWSGSQGNDREAELDSEQIELLKDAPSDERDSANHQALSPWPEEPVQPQHTISPEVPPTHIAWKLALGTTQQPLIASNSVVSQSSSVAQQAMEQFAKMKTMLSYLCGPRQEPTITAFCNYLVSEVEGLVERDFKHSKMRL